ncbi:hypothetical protein QE152_g34785 [Popillia japonica]|uniref:Uncharacterized protein n=1 Tax=Popillia japonica TaxID=7064 RepID=A0AAW1IU12_POPJA
MDKKRSLSDEELLKLAENFGNISDDDFELLSDEDDMDIDNISANALHHFTESVAEPVVSTYNINELPIIFESDNLEIGNATSSIDNNIIENGGQTENDNFDIASCRSMIWKKQENIVYINYAL